MKKFKKLSLRLDEKEYQMLENIANKQKKTKSAVLRGLIKKKAMDKKIASFEKLFEIYAEMLLNFSRLGGNINQIAHHLNAGNFIADSQEFFKIAEEIKTTSRRFAEIIAQQQQDLKKIT